MLSIKCVQCGKEHKATSDKFPIARKEMRYIEAEKTLKPVIVGYLCKWCVLKGVKKEEDKRRDIQQKYNTQVKPIVERKSQKLNIIKRIINAIRRTP